MSLGFDRVVSVFEAKVRIMLLGDALHCLGSLMA